MKFSLLGTMAVMTRKFISEETKNLIWEALGMTAVFEKQMKKLDEERRMKDLKAVLHQDLVEI